MAGPSDLVSCSSTSVLHSKSCWGEAGRFGRERSAINCVRMQPTIHSIEFGLNASSFYLSAERPALSNKVGLFAPAWRMGTPALSKRITAIMSGTLSSIPNPQTIEDVIEQAQSAVQRALEARKTRQLLQILLPVDQRQLNYLDTEPRSSSPSSV